MRSILAFTRHLLLTALALPVAGCGGCTATLETTDWHEWAQQFGDQLYLQSAGPAVLTSAVGAAAPPGGAGGLSAIGTELAWRALLEQLLRPPCDPAAVAGAVGAAAPPGCCVGPSAASVLVGRASKRQLTEVAWRLPSLFEVRQPHQPKTVRGQEELGDARAP